MGIKYSCDFCKKEDIKHFRYVGSEHSDQRELICDDCYQHLIDQKWKIAEDLTSREKKDNELRVKEQKLNAREKVLDDRENKQHAIERADKVLAERYRNTMLLALNMYNQVAEEFYKVTNGYFYQRKFPYEKVNIDKLAECEQMGADIEVRKELDQHYWMLFDRERHDPNDNDYTRMYKFPKIPFFQKDYN